MCPGLGPALAVEEPRGLQAARRPHIARVGQGAIKTYFKNHYGCISLGSKKYYFAVKKRNSHYKLIRKNNKADFFPSLVFLRYSKKHF